MKNEIILILSILFLVGCNDISNQDKGNRTVDKNATTKEVKIKSSKVLMNGIDGLASYNIVDKTIKVENKNKLIQKNELRVQFTLTKNIKKLISDGKKGYYAIGYNVQRDLLKNKYYTKENFDNIIKKITPVSFAISSSIMHLDENLKVLKGQTDLKNNIVIAQDIIKVKNGTVTLFRPSYADKGLYSSSILLFLDQNDKEIKRLQFRQYILNSLFLTKDDKIICSGIKIIRKNNYNDEIKLVEIILVLNKDGSKIRDLTLNDSYMEYHTAYDRDTFIKAYKNQYLIAGVDTLFYLNQDLKTYEKDYLEPTPDWDNMYYLNGIYIDQHNNLVLYGFYGRKVDQQLKKKYKSAADMKEFDAYAINIITDDARKSKAFREKFHEIMYEEMTKNNFSVSKPFILLLLDNDDMINTMKMNIDGSPYYGAGEDGQYLFLESTKTYGYEDSENYKVSSTQELFDKNLNIRMINNENKLYCSMMCSMINNKLIYLSYENNKYILNRDIFVKE